MTSIKLEVYGKHIVVCRTNNAWKIDYISDQGKSRPATDIFIPDFISKSEVERYLEDICHEWATERYPNLRKID